MVGYQVSGRANQAIRRRVAKDGDKVAKLAPPGAVLKFTSYNAVFLLRYLQRDLSEMLANVVGQVRLNCFPHPIGASRDLMRARDHRADPPDIPHFRMEGRACDAP